MAESRASEYVLQLRLSKHLHKQLQERAIERAEPMSVIARYALRAHLERTASERAALRIAAARERASNVPLLRKRVKGPGQ